jgi:hypothetical protein
MTCAGFEKVRGLTELMGFRATRRRAGLHSVSGRPDGLDVDLEEGFLRLDTSWRQDGPPPRGERTPGAQSGGEAGFVVTV